MFQIKIERVTRIYLFYRLGSRIHVLTESSFKKETTNEHPVCPLLHSSRSPHCLPLLRQRRHVSIRIITICRGAAAEGTAATLRGKSQHKQNKVEIDKVALASPPLSRLSLTRLFPHFNPRIDSCHLLIFYANTMI